MISSSLQGRRSDAVATQPTTRAFWLTGPDLLFGLVLVAFCAYGLLVIWRTSFIVEGERYFSLLDDAMISMRYARNLADGYGLVWNPGGDRIEGYTNPLWVLYMAVWHLLPIPPSKLSLPIQLSGLAFLVANLFLVRGIALHISKGSQATALCAVTLTAFYFPINNWSLQGMEVGLLVLLTSAVVYMSLNTLRTGRFSPWVYVLLGTATLVRLDAAVLLLAVALCMALLDSDNRLRHLLFGSGALLAFVAVQTAFRLLYYGDILPNTYYLKVDGFPLIERIRRGLRVSLEFVSSMSWVVFVAAFGILLVRRDRAIILLALLFFSQVAYTIYIGGDTWEGAGSNRFISLVMPLFLVLLSYSAYYFLRALGLSLANRQLPGERRSGPGTLALFVHLIIFLALITWNLQVRSRGTNLEPTVWLLILAAWAIIAILLLRNAARSRSKSLGQPPTGNGATTPHADTASPADGPLAAAQRFNTTALAALVLLLIACLNSLPAPSALSNWHLSGQSAEVIANRFMVVGARTIDRISDANATYSVVWAGITPYFADGRAVDILGKSDRFIAREPWHLPDGPDPWLAAWPGHMKYNYAYSIGQLRPDIIVQFWPYTYFDTLPPWAVIPVEAEPYVSRDYVRAYLGSWIFYLRKDSSHIRWTEVSQLGRVESVIR